MEVLESLIGKTCTFNNGGFNSGMIKGKVTQLKDGWLTVEGKRNNFLLNVEYIVSITVHD